MSYRRQVDLLGKPVIAMTINFKMKKNFQITLDNKIVFYSHDMKERTQFNLRNSPPQDIDVGYWSVLYERLKDRIEKDFYSICFLK